ncbi:MAG TPA: PLP-dependent aminotransferase family protein [Casimicrobiaceae bacterium]|nr:PLP-dependent aminotransferase family protein [Casimicrobiaceae bacterium]
MAARNKEARRQEPKQVRSPARPIAAWLPRLRRTSGAKYISLFDAINEAIAHGDLKGGERLPTQRDLAAMLGVNIATVSKAIAEAGRRGLLLTRRGGGTFVAPPHHGGPRDAAPDAVVDLSINVPPMSPVRSILEQAMAGLSRNAGTDALFGYSPVGGKHQDRDVAAQWLAARGVAASPEDLILTQGAYEGLFAALTALARPGEAIACEALNYSGIRRLAELCRLDLVGVDVDEQGMRPDSLASAVRGGKIKAIVCTPVTLNPTTATQGAERRRAIVDLARRNSVPIIEDDIYGRLAGDELPPLATLWPQGVVYVSGLSKCVAPGLRVGYLCPPPALRSRVHDALLLLAWTAPSLHIALATELIRTGSAAECALAQRAEASRRMALARKLLPSLFASRIALASYHAWLNLPEPWHEREATGALRRHRILVSPAHDFVVGSRAAPAAVRIGLGGVEDANVLERALVTIPDLLATQSSGLGSIA